MHLCVFLKNKCHEEDYRFIYFYFEFISACISAI